MNIVFTYPLYLGYFRKVAFGAMAYASENQDVHLHFMHSPRIITQEWPERVDGMIWTPRPEMLRDGTKIPAISVSSEPIDGITQVCCDNFAVCRMVVDHFRARHFNRLSLLEDTSSGVSEPRKEAFVAACSEKGYESHVITIDHPSEIDIRNQKLVKSLVGMPKPAGLMLQSDKYAPMIYRLCQELEIGIPDGIAVVGVDNLSDFSDSIIPKLSSVDINAEKIGYEATHRLAQMINGQSFPETTLIPPKELIARGSSDIAIGIDPDLEKAMDFMRMNLNQTIEMEDILRQQDLGRRALEQRFQTHFGESPIKFLRNMRLQRAKFLLETTELTVTEIGKRCGFPDSNHLCRLFRRFFEMTPLTYRKQVGEGSAG